MAITVLVTRGFTFATGVDVTAAALNLLGTPIVEIKISSPIAIADGGTNANSASAARVNLGLGTASTQDTSAFLQPSNNLNDVSSQSSSRSNLGLGSIATQSDDAVAITGGTISGTIMRLKSFAVSEVPSASPAGQMIYVTDGDAGAETVAVSNGSNWKVLPLGANIST